MRFLTDSAKLYAALAFALVTGLGLVFTLFGNWSLERQVKGVTARLEATQGQLSRCEALAGNLEASVAHQSEQIDAWKAEADRVRTAGEIATRQAQARARSLEVQLLGARRATVQPGETVCEAADRLILERVG
jgi:uncharacterized protein HemX